MINFDLVLKPAMMAFGQPITVTPLVSQPGAPEYKARGSYTFKPVEIPMDDGTFHSTNQPALGVRLADFPVAPMQEDVITMRQGAFLVTDVIPDGQGGAEIMLRSTDG